MRLRRVYLESALARGARASLSGSAAGHVLRVLRLGVGDELTLFDGSGREFAATIEGAQAGHVQLRVGDASAPQRESPLQLTLAQGISRAERMDLVVQKATELGVTRLVPLLTERSVVRLSPEQATRKLAHWRGVSIAACEQCGRNRLPELDPPRTLTQYLESAAPQATRLLLFAAATLRIADVSPSAGGVTVLIGPEGGLSQEEQQRCLAMGFTPVRLGPRILRTETAALAALALLQREFGDL